MRYDIYINIYIYVIRRLKVKTADLREKFVYHKEINYGMAEGWYCLELNQCATLRGNQLGVCSSTSTDTHLDLFEVYVRPDGPMMQGLQRSGVVA